jgi:hypothetical protein
MCAVLFKALLPDADLPTPSPQPSSEWIPEPIRILRVVPTIQSGTPISINRTSRRSGYWDDPVQSVRPGDVILSFVRFFDWDELGYRDFEYIEVTIDSFHSHPHLIGRFALLQARHAQVLLQSE